MHYVDSHIHIQDYKKQDVKNLVTNAMQYKINTFVNVSSHPNDWGEIKHLADMYRQIIPAYGVHPWYIHDAENDWYQTLEHLIQENRSAWIGECGIDRLKNPNTSEQIEIFKQHIKLAQKYNRPLVVHAVKADMIMRDLFFLLPQRTIFHSFTGSLEWGKEVQKHGFYIGLNQSVLHKKNNERLICGLNFTQVLLETDGPYQSDDKSTETLPWRLPLLAEQIAQILRLPLEELQKMLYINWMNFMEKQHASHT